jgi:hypothetical protein
MLHSNTPQGHPDRIKVREGGVEALSASELTRYSVSAKGEVQVCGDQVSMSFVNTSVLKAIQDITAPLRSWHACTKQEVAAAQRKVPRSIHSRCVSDWLKQHIKTIASLSVLLHCSALYT